jgi:UDP-GlcNAc:undecaprenyl-phosphate GlcNAc-1-phosphate transferase
LFVNSAFRLVPAQTSVSLLPLALVGACLGFLMYNFNPARVFMGSSGAYFLGYALGTLSIIGGAKMATILLVMGLPLLDVMWQVVNRMSQGRSPFHGDRGHLHFRLVDLGYNQRLIVLSYYLFCAFFGVLTLVITSRLYKAVALGLMALFVAIGFYLLKRMETHSSSASSST